MENFNNLLAIDDKNNAKLPSYVPCSFVNINTIVSIKNLCQIFLFSNFKIYHINVDWNVWFLRGRNREYKDPPW